MNEQIATEAVKTAIADPFLVSIGICTFRRPALFDTLKSIAAQDLPDGYQIDIVVADNDDEATLGKQIDAFAKENDLKILYRHAPARNISIARNACMDAARGDALIFIDDDETAEPDWLQNLIAAWRQRGVSVVFGPSYANYPEETPPWMVENDVHSNIPLMRGGIVETGYSCNVLLDFRSARVRETRFDEAFGRTGGEDTDFFFRLHRKGVRMAITMDAVVREPVAQKRLSRDYVMQRRFSTGQSYGHCVTSAGRNAPYVERALLALRSAAKTAYCGLRAGLSLPRESRRNFWLMRGMFHAGVARGAWSRPELQHYGGEGV